MSLVLAHVSDLHLGAHSDRVVADLVADVTAAAADVTVVTGDLTMRARPEQFRRARAVLARLPGPRLVVLGNHDVPLVNVALRLTAPYRRYRRYLDPVLDPMLDLPGMRLLGLASMPRWRWKSGAVPAARAERIPRLLGSAPASAVRIVALHHPLSQTAPGGIAGRRRLLAALAEARVDLVLAGHTHVPAVRPLPLDGRCAVEVVAGTATSLRTRGTSQSWTKLRIDAGTVSVEHRYHDGTGWYGAREAILTLGG